jgi:DNA-binding CsgD family transcriptional regulator
VSHARALLEQCGGILPATMTTLGDGVQLSAREREVVLLAARGLTSRAIGERLFLSTRTVEGHLQRTYTKLGVTNRAELAPLVRFIATDSNEDKPN